jgi:hypothetical protein
MLIYGWSIIAKVASLDWNNRKRFPDRYSKKQIFVSDIGKKAEKNTFGNDKSGMGISYAEAVKGMVGNSGTNERMVKGGEEVVKWEEESSEDSWLKYCAVGVLKTFADVYPLIKGLLDLQIKSSSFYMGDKNILWIFNSITERDDFIRRRCLWEGFFSSMGNWNPAVTPQSRLVWVEFRGVPLNCWCDEFFHRLGWAVGEPLLIEEETQNKEVLTIGRVLVLIPFRSKCPETIKVMTGRNSFPISVWEDPAPVKPAWISWRLGIDDRFVSDSSYPVTECNDIWQGEDYRSARGNVSDFKIGGVVPLKSNLNSSLDVQMKVDQPNKDSGNDFGKGHFGKAHLDRPVRPYVRNGDPKSVNSKGKGVLTSECNTKSLGPNNHHSLIAFGKKKISVMRRIGKKM